MREQLRKLILAVPPVVVPVTVSTIGEDSGTTVFGTRKKGGDPRDTKDWKSAHKVDAQQRTYESAPLRWETQPTNTKLLRPVRSYVDAAEGVIRFDADCNEAEVSYVLSRFVQA